MNKPSNFIKQVCRGFSVHNPEDGKSRQLKKGCLFVVEKEKEERHLSLTAETLVPYTPRLLLFDPMERIPPSPTSDPSASLATVR